MKQLLVNGSLAHVRIMGSDAKAHDTTRGYEMDQDLLWEGSSNRQPAALGRFSTEI